MLGLLLDLPRKNCWTIAEWAGEASPHGMQHLLCRAVWDADGLRDDVRENVVEHLSDDAAVLVVDETDDVKEGHPHGRGPAPVHRNCRVRRQQRIAGVVERSELPPTDVDGWSALEVTLTQTYAQSASGGPHT